MLERTVVPPSALTDPSPVLVDCERGKEDNICLSQNLRAHRCTQDLERTWQSLHGRRVPHHPRWIGQATPVLSDEGWHKTTGNSAEKQTNIGLCRSGQEQSGKKIAIGQAKGAEEPPPGFHQSRALRVNLAGQRLSRGEGPPISPGFKAASCQFVFSTLMSLRTGLLTDRLFTLVAHADSPSSSLVWSS